MNAVDPTYPLFPIAEVISSAMLLLVLLNSYLRHNWNLGVAFLCFWLFLENLMNAAGAVIWSDNADIKLYAYCDIVSHLQMIVYVVKPMATLIITRRLYLVISDHSVDSSSKAARRNLVVEWTLGLVIPLLVAGPIYYIHQAFRFAVDEGFGCGNSIIPSILELLTLESWTVVPPRVSVIFYYPRVIRLFYRQSRVSDSFVCSGNSSTITRTSYFRILILASIDILLTLPFGIVSIVLTITAALSPPAYYPFYPGWTYLHTDWEPVAYTYADTIAGGISNLAQLYFAQWTSPVLAFVIFGLFGWTAEARQSYWDVVCTIGAWFGWKQNARKNGHPAFESLGEMQFGTRPLDTVQDVETGTPPPIYRASMTDKDTRYAPHECEPDRCQ
ncbi:unnamed protein product [Peniophora sp. CBMAI 1063]|nr:unnamed protein product [Peniophora sp. CBMAI 1063]